MLTWWFAAVAAAGPGFTGVGGPERAPGFTLMDAEEDEDVLAEVLRREDELLRLVGEHDPALLEQLRTLKATDRRAYLAALVRVGRNVQRARRDPDFRERIVAIRARSRQVQELARGYAALPPAQQPARRAELERLAGELMDLKQADRRARLDELRTRLAELEAEIARRERDREQIIDDFVDQLLEPKVDL